MRENKDQKKLRIWTFFTQYFWTILAFQFTRLSNFKHDFSVRKLHDSILLGSELTDLWLMAEKNSLNTQAYPMILMTLPKKDPYSELFWSAFPRIWTGYRKIGTRLTPNTDTLHAVWVVWNIDNVFGNKRYFDDHISDSIHCNCI